MGSGASPAVGGSPLPETLVRYQNADARVTSQYGRLPALLRTAGSARRDESARPDPLSPASWLVSADESHLSYFYRSLAATERGEPGALTRVSQMGDSSAGLDQLPHAIRSRMQERFGDGGAGFVLLQPHSRSYVNRLAQPRVTRDWRFCFIIRGCRSDGRYGLGGVSFAGRGSSTTSYHTRRGSPISKFELWYAAGPGGGRISVRVDRREPTIVHTDAKRLEDRWRSFRVTPGRHRFRVRAAGGGTVRAYGVVLETDGPGVVWDTLSMYGAFTPRVLNQDPDHIATQLRHRDSDLLILNYGGNDLGRYAAGRVTVAKFEAETRQVIRLLRRGKPSMSCLVMGINDHLKSGHRPIRPKHVEALLEAQRRVALVEGCAFFDTYQAMGGRGSFRRWMRRGMASYDRVHLTAKGRYEIGKQVYTALMKGFDSYQKRQLKLPQPSYAGLTVE